MFEKQIAWAAKEDLFISPESVAGVLNGSAGRTSGIIVTIDDCDPSVYAVALPILRKYGVEAVLFAITDRIGSDNHMTAAQLKSSVDQGFVVGSHSRSHPHMAKLDAEQLQSEAALSRRILQDITGSPVEMFAYPYGNKQSISPETRSALEAAGYSIAFTSQMGAVTPGVDPLAVPRLNIEHGDPVWTFGALCHGHLDDWDAACRSLGLSRFQY
ncbi:polysaccharide deacetylase family protein [Salinarimonas soli]|uniref:polysaccharide deacetylase family protein n=1 Tax=Salinarimonas soli TaxID=1638099 RepID=UPI001661D66D|nr:polysaccharide deacetylase family protein [Salinarimonas soli]